MTFLSGSEVLNPLQSGPEFTPWDLARTSDPERNVMGQSTEMSLLVSMLFQTFLNPLKYLLDFYILVNIYPHIKYILMGVSTSSCTD